MLRLAEPTGAPTRPLPEPLGGLAVDLVDPSGIPVRVVAGMHRPARCCRRSAAHLQLRARARRGSTRRNVRPRVPAKVQRLGHVVLQTTKYLEALNWYLDNLGMIVSDFLFFPGQRERGPTMSFIRCDRGVDADRPPHPGDGAGSDQPLRAFGLSGLRPRRAGRRRRIPRERGYFRSWGIGRHIQGSQIFDYWRDPDGFMVEHFADGDMFDTTLEPGWAPFTASGLAQWGPPATKDFLGTNPKSLPHEARVDDHRTSQRQRIRYQPPHRPPESSQLMTISVLRTADAWWVQTPNWRRQNRRPPRPPPVSCWPTAPPSTTAAHSSDTVPVDSLELRVAR